MRHEYSHAPRQSWQAVTGLVGWTIVYVQTLSFMRWPRLVVADAPYAREGSATTLADCGGSSRMHHEPCHDLT